MAIWPLKSSTTPFNIRQTEVFIQAEQHHSSWNCPGSPAALQPSSFSLLLHQTGSVDAQHISSILLHSVILIPYRYFFPPTNMLQRLFWMLKVRMPIAQCIPKGCLEAHTDLSCSKLPLLACECFHLLFTMSECFIWSELLTTSPQHHPKRRNHLQVTLFFPQFHVRSQLLFMYYKNNLLSLLCSVTFQQWPYWDHPWSSL